MKKKVIFSLLYIYFLYISIYSSSLEFSSVLGFGGRYKENSWTPLLIRINNNGPALSGDLIVETINSSSATMQKRQYIKAVDLSSDSVKILSFIIPIGHHNQDIRYYFQSRNSILFENIISLKQKGIKKNFLLGVSPYPDLPFLNDYNSMKERFISYPHIDNLPENSMGYKSVDIISIHREFMDRLSLLQFRAISGWVSGGGILVVWGGKSPSPSKWDYLPSKITGLKKIDILNSQVVNLVETPEHNRLIREKGFDLLTFRKTGLGYVYFATFDYRGRSINDSDLKTIWQIIFNSPENKNWLENSMKSEFSVNQFIAFFDKSPFKHMDKTNVTLILFLSASATISMVLFIRYKRESKNITTYIGGMLVYLIILSAFIFISLFSKNLRTDGSVISINLLYHTGNESDAIFYKDIHIGTTNKSASDIIIRDDNRSALMQENYENLNIRNSPEVKIENLMMNQWSSKTMRLESMIEPIVSLLVRENQNTYFIEIMNQSDILIRNSFFLLNGEVYEAGNIMPGNKILFELDKITNNKSSAENIDYVSDPFLNTITNHYINPLIQSESLVFCGYYGDELHPLEFTNPTWENKSVNMVLFQVRLKEDENEKSSF